MMLNATHFTLPWSDAVMPMPSAVDAIVDVMSRRCRVDRIRPWSVRLSVELTHQLGELLIGRRQRNRRQ